MIKYDTTKKTTTKKLTKEGFELLHTHRTWYVIKNGLAYAGFSTKKEAITAMMHYVERG